MTLLLNRTYGLSGGYFGGCKRLPDDLKGNVPETRFRGTAGFGETKMCNGVRGF